MVNVPLDHDEFYPVYFFDYGRFGQFVLGALDMTNSEFVQMVILQERWRRMQDDLAQRMGYYK